jgi:hypothetical protein
MFRRFLHVPGGSAWVHTDVSQSFAYLMTPG